jgi:hypothetical protein
VKNLPATGHEDGGEGVSAPAPAGVKAATTRPRTAAAGKAPPATASKTRSARAGKPAAGIVSQTAAGISKAAAVADKRTTSVAALKTASDSQPSQPEVPSPGPADSPAIPLAVDIGWTMAVLFGQLRPAMDQPSDRLPTEHELPPDQRVGLEVERVNSLLARLGALLPASPKTATGVPDDAVISAPAAAGGTSAAAPAPAGGFHEDLEKANLAILKWLARAGREFGLAYQLGRSLRDTANPPLRSGPAGADAGTDQGQPADIGGLSLTPAQQTEIETQAGKIQTACEQEAELAGHVLTDDEKAEFISAAKAQALRQFAARDAVKSQLSRPRVSKLQEWLATLAERLPTDSAAIVSASVGRWCDFTATVFEPSTPGSLKTRGVTGSYPSQLDVAGEVLDSLLPQGDAWLNLLVGTESSCGLLTPEGFVAAGEAALGRTARIIRKIALHYWFALLVLAAVLAGILYAAARDLSGAAKVWTQIAAVASALGVTTKGIGSSMTELSRDAEKPIFGLEKIDAMAWAVTSLPVEMKLNNAGVRALRRSGIPRSGPLGRV